MGLYAGIELGGTKTVVGLVSGDGRLLARSTHPTRDPDETLVDVADAVDRLTHAHGPIDGIGVGAFGPVHVNPASPDYGRLGRTPKLAWVDFDLIGFFSDRFALPIALDTDVSAAAHGEVRWGAARDAKSVVYITIGTGIGAGILINGQSVHGVLHPEVGHIRVPCAAGDEYAGGCPHHGDCLEGMAAGPAIIARWGTPLNELHSDHDAWRCVSHYLGHLVSNVILFVAPERIVLGGGVMSNSALYPLVHSKVQSLLNGYISVPEVLEGLDTLVVTPGLGSDAGVLGSAALVIPVLAADG